MLDEKDLSQKLEQGADRGVAQLVIQAVAGGEPVVQIGRTLVRAATPHLDLCAALPFPTRTLDVVYAAVRAAPRLPPRLRAMVLGRAAAVVAAAPHPRRPPPDALAPGVPPEDPSAALAGALKRGDLPLARGLLPAVLGRPKGMAALGKALVDGTSGDAFQGGEKLLVAIAAWMLGKGLPEGALGPLIDRVLPYLASDPRDPTPGRVFEALERGRAAPPLEPEGLDPQWLLSLARGLMTSQLRVSLPRLLHRRVLKTLAGRVTLPDVAPPDHVSYAEALVARSMGNLPDTLRPLHEALRRGDRARSLPLVVDVLGDGRGYGRVLRLAALVGAERMLVREYRWGFGMAQDLRLCHAAAVLADTLGVKDAVPAVMLCAWVVGRGGASVSAGAVGAPPLYGEPSERERDVWLAQLTEAIDARELCPAREALGALMGGLTPISQVNRALLASAASRVDEGSLALSYTQACVEVAEHMPRLDAELVLAAAMCHLLLGTRRADEPWLLELLDEHRWEG